MTNFKSCREESKSTFDLPNIKIQGVAGASLASRNVDTERQGIWKELDALCSCNLQILIIEFRVGTWPLNISS
jgi:hypothetical protein